MEAMLQETKGGPQLTSSKKLKLLVPYSAQSCGQQSHGLTRKSSTVLNS